MVDDALLDERKIGLSLTKLRREVIAAFAALKFLTLNTPVIKLPVEFARAEKSPADTSEEPTLTAEYPV